MYKKWKDSQKTQSVVEEAEEEDDSENLQSLPGKELVRRILREHDAQAAGVTGRNSVRLFISSTFTDTKTERNHLMQHVYPEIRDFCQKHALQFSVVDLRWGIREHATDDHRTTEICLSEIDRCQSSTIYGAPCFVYLGFDRYGGPTLPRIVPAKEMELLIHCIQDDSTLTLIRKWYKKDENSLNPMYVLQPISSEIPDFVNTTDAKRLKELRAQWVEIETKMLSALTKAATQHPQLDEKQQSNWILSTTHKEVEHLLKRVLKRKITALIYDRRIKDFVNMNKPRKEMGNLVWRYIDLDNDNNVDDQKQKLLRKQKIEMKTKKIPSATFDVNWHEKGIMEDEHKEYLRSFADKVKEDLMGQITDAVQSQNNIDPETIEVASHVKFCAKRAQGFHGRSALLEQALKYFDRDEEGRQMLVIHGVSGAGKTSFMCKLAMEAKRRFEEKGKKPVLITRFCGTTGNSSNAQGIMKSIAIQVMRAIEGMPSFAYKSLSDDFSSIADAMRYKMMHGTARAPLLVFIDSLDQLTDEDLARSNTSWLPEKLSEHAFLVVSTLPEIGGCLNSLRSRLSQKENFLEVKQLPTGDVQTILNTWLQQSGRTLQEEQTQYLMKLTKQEVDGEKPTALRIKLLFDLASKWTSYEILEDISPSVKDLISAFFKKLEDAHGQVLVKRFFGLMNSAKKGLSEEELIDILSTDDDVMNSVFQFHQPPIRRLPQIVFARLRNAIGEYIVERGAHGKTVLAWYHRQFQEVCKWRYKESARTENVKFDGTPSPELIAAYFSQDAHMKFPDRGLTPQPLYWIRQEGYDFNLSKLSEMSHAFYLLETRFNKEGSAMKAAEHLCSLKFISAKCQAGLGRELVKDFSDITDVLKTKMRKSVKKQGNTEGNSTLGDGTYKIGDYFRFITSNIHIIEEDQSKLFQQAINMPTTNHVQHEAQSIDPNDISPWNVGNKRWEQKPVVHLVNKPVGEGPCQFVMSEHKGEITDIALVQNSLVITSSKDGSVIVWSATTGEVLLKIGIGASVEQLRISQADKSLFGITAIDITGRVHSTIINHDEDGIDSSPLTSWQTHEEGPVDQVRFATKKDDSKIVTAICKREGDNQFRGELKMWGIGEWMGMAGETPKAEITDMEKLKTMKHEGITFGIWFVDYSPDDRFIIIVLNSDSMMSMTLNNVLNNIITILHEDTLEPLWSWAFMNYNPPQLSIQRCEELIPSKRRQSESTGCSEWDMLVPKHYGICRLKINILNSNSVRAINLWDKQMPSLDHMAVFNDKYGNTILLSVKDEVKMLQRPPTDPGHPENWGDCTSIKSFLGNLEMQDAGRLKGHGSRVKVIRASKSHSLCYSGCEDGTLAIWDLSLVQSYLSHKSHQSQIFSIALSPDKNLILTGGGMGVMNERTDIKCWDARTGELLGSSHALDEYVVSAMQFTPDGKFFCTHCSSRPRLLQFFSAADLGKETVKLEAEFEIATKFDNAPTLAISNGELVSTPNLDGTNGLDIHPDGKFMCSTMGNNTEISLIDIEKKVARNIEAHVGSVLGGKFTPDGQYLATWCSGFKNPRDLKLTEKDTAAQVKVWSVGGDGSLEEVSVYDLEEADSTVIKGDYEFTGMVNKAGVTSVCFTPDSKTLLAGTTAGKVLLLKVPELKFIWSAPFHEQMINHVNVASANHRDAFLLTCSDDKWVKVIDACKAKYGNEGLTQYYVGAKVTCITGFCEGETLFIHCTDSHGRLSVLKVSIPDLVAARI